MPLLEQTQLSLTELSASRQYDFGAHAGLQVKSGVPGTDVGEFPFDPAKHSPVDIYPFSLMELATGIPHVRMVIPHRPLEANVIVHDDNLTTDDPRVVRMKYTLANDVMRSIEDTLPGITDRTMPYELSDDASEHDPESGVEVISIDGKEPIVAAKTTAELCAEALTFVISDFKRLPLHEVDADYSSTIAIKVNHVAEMFLPANVGVISLGDTAEVNTNNTSELTGFNDALTERHMAIVQRLQNAGIAVAHVVFNRKDYPEFGFDIEAADKEIAAAVQSREA